MTIAAEHRNDVYRYIWSLIREMKCKLIRIGGIANHVHMLVDLHPEVNLAQFMRSIKSKSAGWMNSDDRFPNFKGWAADYYASSVSPEFSSRIEAYIRNQEQHHSANNFHAELEELYRNAGLWLHPKDLV